MFDRRSCTKFSFRLVVSDAFSVTRVEGFGDPSSLRRTNIPWSLDGFLSPRVLAVAELGGRSYGVAADGSVSAGARALALQTVAVEKQYSVCLSSVRAD